MKTENCNRPPEGWECNLRRDHKGSCPAYPISNAAKGEIIMHKFLAFKNDLWSSHATTDEKELMWADFLRIFTGTA